MPRLHWSHAGRRAAPEDLGNAVVANGRLSRQHKAKKT